MHDHKLPEPLGGGYGTGVEGLLFLLRSGEVQQRADAAMLLGAYGGPRVVATLVDALQNEDDTAVLIHIVASLDRIGDPRAVSALDAIAAWDTNALTYHEETVQASAMVAAHRLRHGRP